MKINFKKSTFYCVVVTLVISASLFSGCSKDITVPANKTTEVQSVLKAINASSADAAVTSFINAFVYQSGNTAYIKRNLIGNVAEGNWVAALEILAMEDMYERTGKPEHKTLINNLLTTFMVNNPRNTWSPTFNDDIGWVSLALIRGYQITGNSSFLTEARYGFDMAWARGWDTQYFGGGVWQIQPSADSNPHKDPLANNSLGKVACYIYQSIGDPWYLARANDLYNWAWNHIYDPNTGLVYNALFANGTIDKLPRAYNQGTYADFAYLMYKITGNTNYRRDAIKIIDYTMNNQTTNGIISNSESSLATWGDEMARAVGHMCRIDPTLWDKYWGWMKQNANSIWDNRRTDVNATWNAWDQKTPTSATVTVTFVSAFAWLQYTPETKPSSSVSIANGTYKIISRQNGYALDAAGNGTGNNTAIDTWGYWGGNNQRWTLTSLGGGMYKIIGVGSGRSIDVAGASDGNGANVVLYDYQNSYNQNIYLSSPASGYYTITFVHSGMALDLNVSNNTIGQWPFTGGNNQQWQFQIP